MTQIKQFFAQNLFASPVWGFEIPDADLLNAALIEDCRARQKQEPSMEVSNQAGLIPAWITKHIAMANRLNRTAVICQSHGQLANQQTPK